MSAPVVRASVIRSIPVVPLAAVAIASALLAGTASAQQPMARVSVDSNGVEADLASSNASLSADGRFVAFQSRASNLVADDTNDVADIFVHDRVTGATVRVNVDSAGNEADRASSDPSLSADGRFVAFASLAAHLVLHDTNSRSDVFVHDRDPDGNGVFDEGNGVTTRVSVDSAGKQGNEDSYSAAISADGSHVVFVSAASNLVAGDGNHVNDIFVHDRTTGVTVRASVDSAGVEADGWNLAPSISADGHVVAFTSMASNLVAGDTNADFDVFLHDLGTGATTRVSVDSAGAQTSSFCSTTSGALSADGTRVVFVSGAADLVADDTNRFVDAFVHDVTDGSTIRASLGQGGVESDSDVWDASISGDGNFVVFSTPAGTLAPNDGNDFLDVFVFDRTVIPLQAAWANYDAGFAGSLGVPDFLLTADPEFGASLQLQIGNSSGQWSVAFVVIGTVRAAIPLHSGAMLLVLPQTILPCGLPPSGFPISCTVPFDNGLYGFVLDLQAIEFDAGASGGFSFTSGLELVFGQ